MKQTKRIGKEKALSEAQATGACNMLECTLCQPPA